MARLEIRYLTGDVEERELSRQQTLSIGRHPSNDVRIDEENVELLHCRIAWNKHGYEVTAAGDNGLEVNGTFVRHAVLRDNDLIRIGTVDLLVRLEPADSVSPDENSPSEKRRHRVARRPKPLPDDLFEEDDIEPVSSSDVEPAGGSSHAGLKSDVAPGSEDSADAAGALAEDEEDFGESPFDEEAARREKERSLIERLRRRLDEQAVRPGEQDILRSKFLIGLIVGMAVLALTSGVLWFWTQLNAAEKLKEQADELYKEQKYKQAIQLYDDFLKTYPRNKLTNAVFFSRARARVEQFLAGTSPNWKEALAAVNEFVEENREREGYAEYTETLRDYASRIALGACRTAEQTKDRRFLPLAEDAARLSRQFQSEREFERDFAAAYRSAKREVERRERFDAAVQDIETALAAGKIDAAIQHRLDFLQFVGQQPRPEEQQPLQRLLQQTMEAERARVRAVEVNRAAETKDHPERLRQPRSLLRHIPPKQFDSSRGVEIILAVVKNCCYGVNAGTGEPVWRRAIGMDTPFFPVSCEVDAPAVLVFDTDFGELILLNRADGRLKWRLPLQDEKQQAEQLAGPPLVIDGQIFAVSRNRRLYHIDLDSGRLLRLVTFSQPVTAPPVMTASRDRLILAGRQALVYTVTLKPTLSCERVTFLGHQPGSVRAPLLRIGRLVLLCENGGVGQAAFCRLRVLNSAAGKPAEWLQELTFNDPDRQVRVPGHVLDAPMLWSNKLYVISGGRWISVFTVSDDTRQPQAERTRDQFLREIARKELKQPLPGPAYLLPGPNRQLWLAGVGLQKFHLKTRSLQIDNKPGIPYGQATQPPQMLRSSIFLGRRLRFSRAVNLSETNRDEMVGSWRVVLGAQLLAWSVTPGKPMIALNEEGHLFRVQPQEIDEGGFQLEIIGTLEYPGELEKPLRATTLPDGNIIAAVGRPKPAVSVINASGQIVRVETLRDGLEANPAALEHGVVLPLPGRLQFLPLRRGGSVVEYQAPVEKDAPPAHWLQLAALSPTELIALNSRGQLLRVQVRNANGRRFLAVAVQRTLTPPPLKGFVIHRDEILIADAKGTVHLLNGRTLQPRATIATGGSLAGPLSLAGGYLFVELQNGLCRCYSVSGAPRQKWEFRLHSRSGLAGAPRLQGDTLLLAERNGTIHWLAAETGVETSQIHLAEPLAEAPFKMEGSWVVPTIDGSLYRLSRPAAVGK